MGLIDLQEPREMLASLTGWLRRHEHELLDIASTADDLCERQLGDRIAYAAQETADATDMVAALARKI